jgi:hypothetical protein
MWIQKFVRVFVSLFLACLSISRMEYYELVVDDE